MSDTPRDCKHGQLARSCEICDLEREFAAMTAERNALRGECERVKGERNAIGVRIRGEWMGKADALAKERDTALAALASLRLKMLHDTAALIRERDTAQKALRLACGRLVYAGICVTPGDCKHPGEYKGVEDDEKTCADCWHAHLTTMAAAQDTTERKA